MITSDRQVKVAEKKIEDLERSLTSDFSDIPQEMRPGILSQRRRLISEMRAEISDYFKLKSRPVKIEDHASLNDFRLIPIRFRVSHHLTIEQFASLVGIHSRQIARYEEQEYKAISIEKLTGIVEKLKLAETDELRIG